ncbi:MAG TPA: PAS domain-containing protein [Solirubrobacteraceae bacterium]|nr:PAS domain-containing protein [Solirubrobacteraceae bacterium]
MGVERHFICPHCANRSMGTDRTAGFSGQARGCERCGFAYLFELLDDYYPAPAAAFFACDAEGRIVDCGRGAFELTGLSTERAIGRPAVQALGLSFEDGTDHVAQALEWEVGVHGKPVVVRGERDSPTRAIADIFPAYDDEDGGVLIVLTPTNHAGPERAPAH